MGLSKGSKANCKGCNRKHIRPWGKYCREVFKARAHAEFLGDTAEDYKRYLFLEIPADCEVKYPLGEGDGGDENELVEEDPDKKNVSGSVPPLPGAGLATPLEQHQARKITSLELELAKLRDDLSHVGLAGHGVTSSTPMVVPTPSIVPPVGPDVKPVVTSLPPGLGLPGSLGGYGLPVATTMPAMVYSHPVYTCASTLSGVATTFSSPSIMGGGMTSPPPWAAGPASTHVTGLTAGAGLPSAGRPSPYVVSPAAVMAALSLSSGSSSMIQPIPSGFWQQPLQVQFQPSSGKHKFDHFIPQAVGQSHVYSIEEIVGASLALIDYRMNQNLPIGGYLSHLRFILERAASKVHKDQSLIDYDRFIRERAEALGPSVMGYGDLEGINRYLAVGSLRSTSAFGAPGSSGKRQSKSSNIC